MRAQNFLLPPLMIVGGAQLLYCSAPIHHAHFMGSASKALNASCSFLRLAYIFSGRHVADTMALTSHGVA